MKILAVETSSSTASVAIHEDGWLLGEMSINNKKTHSQKLMPLLDSLMNELSLTPGDIDYFAVSIGPGSFTGLRIGVATVKAIAYACNKPTVAVPTLDAMASGLSEMQGIICPMLDARNDQVFTAIYKATGGKMEKTSEYLGITKNELVDLLKTYTEDILFTGDGVVLHRDFLIENLGDRARFAPAGRNLNRASDVALAAIGMIQNGDVCDCMKLKPFYLRKSQAERLKETK